MVIFHSYVGHYQRVHPIKSLEKTPLSQGMDQSPSRHRVCAACLHEIRGRSNCCPVCRAAQLPSCVGRSCGNGSDVDICSHVNLENLGYIAIDIPSYISIDILGYAYAVLCVFGYVLVLSKCQKWLYFEPYPYTFAETQLLVQNLSFLLG